MKPGKFGYQLSEDGRLLQVSREQEVLALIRELRNAGHAYVMIAEELNRRGFTTRTGRQWNPASVMSVVSRR